MVGEAGDARRRRGAAGRAGRAARGRAGRTRARRSGRPSSMPDVERRRARADREVGIAELRRHRARRLPALAQVRGEAVGHPAQLVVQPLDVADVALERLLDRDRDPLGRDLERPRVDPARAVADEPADLAGKHPRELGVARARRASPIVSTPAAASLAAARGPDPGQHPDRERREERRLAARPDDGQPAGLAAVGGDLRDDLRGRDAERAREPRPRPDDGAHGLGERARVVERRRDLAEVEVALVDPGLLDRRHDLAHDRPDLPRVLAVERAARADEHGLPGSAGAPRRTTSPRRPRTAARRSSRSRRRRGRAGRRRRRAARRRSSGLSSSSTAAKNASRSRWATITPDEGRRRRR